MSEEKLPQDEVELTTIDKKKMTPKEEEIYNRRMRILKNKFLPRRPLPDGRVRKTEEQLAEEEKVSLRTIESDVAWLKETYPYLWSVEQIKSGFAYTMMETSGMYAEMIEDLYDEFWEAELEDKLKIATTLNNLMPTYTNSKGHGALLKDMKETAERNEKRIS